jgi:FkbM family methyltransferase
MQKLEHEVEMKQLVKRALELLMGRRMLWLLGKSMYLHARRDAWNEAPVNGEEFAQRQLLHAFTAMNEHLVVFDVGANVGEWSRFLLDQVEDDLKQRMRIHAFEPVPATCEVLREALHAHRNAECTVVRQLAMSDSSGRAEIFLSGETAGTNSMHADAQQSGQKRIGIETTTIERYCEEQSIQTVHYIKCDVEGHDMAVILGAASMFRAERIMVLQFEYNIRWVYGRFYLKDVFDMFADSPYQIGKVTPYGFELYERWRPELERYIEGNYVIIHPRVRSWFRNTVGDFDEQFVYRPSAGIGR